MVNAILFGLFWLFAWIFTFMPKIILYRFGDLIFFFLYIIFGYRKKVVRENLRNSFPEKPEKELRKIERKFYIHLSDIFIENLAMVHMPHWRFRKFIKHVNPELVSDYYDKGKSVIVAMGHYGNWEFMIDIPYHLKYENTCAIYKPIKNKHFNSFYRSIRTRFNGVAISMFEVLRVMMDFNRKKKITALFIVTDQTPHRDKITYYYNFLNQPTAMFLGIEKMAVKFNQPVMFCTMHKPKRGKYEVVYEKLVDDPKSTKEYEITNLHAKKLEEKIREKPEHWLWSHRRWKYKPNENAVIDNG